LLTDHFFVLEQHREKDSGAIMVMLARFAPETTPFLCLRKSCFYSTR